MAGRFVSLEEAARLLGVSVDEVSRLVDRKKLFPMRDGANVKFRADDVERVARDLGEDQSQSDDLSLDLDLPAVPAATAPEPGTDEIALGDAIDFAVGGDADDAAAIAQTIVRNEPAAGSATPVAESVLDDIGGDADLSLEPLESIVGASSPSLSHQSQSPSTGVGGGVGDSLALEMSNVTASGSSQVGSIPGLSSNDATMMLSGAIDSGISLEASDPDMASGGASVIYPAESSGAFGGDEFILGGETTEEESASVVIPTEDTGDSSFFGAAIDGEGSQFTTGDSSANSASVILEPAPEFTMDTPFSGLQITGLVFCSLLLLGGGFVVFDLVRTIGSAEGPMLANPVLDRIAETFGWR